jgi:hypothetical protein
MTIFYSASRAGFFDDAIHDVVPDDAIAISTEYYRLLMTAQTEGMLIVGGPDGVPIASARPGLSADEALEVLRAERNRLLTASDYTQMPDAPLTDAQRETWRIYRQALRDLPETNSDPAACAWPVTPA